MPKLGPGRRAAPLRRSEAQLTSEASTKLLNQAATTAKLARAFGRRFRRARLKAGLWPKDVETITKVPRAFLREIEAGQGNPTVATLTALALVVGMDLPTLMAAPRSRAAD